MKAGATGNRTCKISSSFSKDPKRLPGLILLPLRKLLHHGTQVIFIFRGWHRGEARGLARAQSNERASHSSIFSGHFLLHSGLIQLNALQQINRKMIDYLAAYTMADCI